MGLINKLKKIYKLLKNNEFEPVVMENRSLEQTQFLYNILYRGNAAEKIDYYSGFSDGCEKFWTSVKKHQIPTKVSSLPSETLNTFINIIKKNLNEIIIDNKYIDNEFNKLNKKNRFKNIIISGTKNGLIYGDSVFIVDILKDKTVNIEVYSGNLVDIEKDYLGNISKIVCYKEFFEDDKAYKLKSIYSYGHNKKEVYKNNNIINFYSVNYTKNMLEDYIFNKEIITGIFYAPLGESSLFKNRGRSIYESKEDSIDFLDEVFSIWDASLRKTLPISYLPLNTIPVNKDGNPIKPDTFSHIFIQSSGPMPETGINKIEFTQANLPVDELERSMSQAVSEFCQGLISPASLAISDKRYRDANAAYAQEMEKQTITTVNLIFENLVESVKQLVFVWITINTGVYNKDLEDIITIKYSPYGTPSMESKIDIVNKADKIMSLKEKIEFLYGDDRSEEWKKEEIARIRGTNKNYIKEIKQEEIEEDKNFDHE